METRNHLNKRNKLKQVATTRINMKKSLIILGVILFTSMTITSCGKKASDYENIIKEYKEVLCIGMNSNSSTSDKSKALERQLELNKEYEAALKDLSQDEQSKLMMSWSTAVSEGMTGKCD